MSDRSNSQVHLVGGGIAALAAASFLIRDARVPGENIHIYEQHPVLGGALDGAIAPTAEGGYVTRGMRIFERDHDVCARDLLDSIPAPDDPGISVGAQIRRFNDEQPNRANARIMLRDHSIADASVLGLDACDRLDLARLLTTPEPEIGSRRIDQLFQSHFFDSNFWCLWRTTFAFQTWYSAIELKRHLLCFAQEVDRIHTLAGFRRSRYNQYDSIVVPIQAWLEKYGVKTEFGVVVDDIEFDSSDPDARRATALRLTRPGGSADTVALDREDYVFVTNGSLIADTTYADRTTVPDLVRDRRDGSWRLWQRLADKADDFGHPSVFCDHVDASRWESFTLTMCGSALTDRIRQCTGNRPGQSAALTFKDSSWLMSIVVPAQPHFRDQQPEIRTLWGFGMFGGIPGDYVGKTMDDCTGDDVVTELLGQLGCTDLADEVHGATRVTTVQMPYVGSPFAPRTVSDRPKVVPDGARNFAFLGQFVEIPEGVVRTVEYSVRSAMIAVYHHFGVARPIPPVYHGLADPKIAMSVLHTALG
jgi:oleate hydratase